MVQRVEQLLCPRLGIASKTSSSQTKWPGIYSVAFIFGHLQSLVLFIFILAYKYQLVA